ncbi:MAG: FAD-dependent oxidoreductase [Deltaproteobacteria bacterium]|nr:FAD-dependent oxidoreductase [Deltaproteobacteria bacterium]MBW2074302.1 FAD-dependent oxidoreductase [Deltaproteobacteria bacterium]RLB82876.1 MAG: thioredoxin reductase [Deltaproteobacteria bacterium]
MTQDLYDVAIIGCGPAGLQAAIHAASKKAKVIVFGKPTKSSLYKAHIANFCCYEKPISGKDILEAGRKQAESFDAVFLEEDIVKTKKENNLFSLVTESGETFTSRSLLLCMGIARKKLRVKGEKKFEGRGVSYCVDCDANFYKGLDVAVVGNESAAATGALTLLLYAKTVYLICRKLMISDMLYEELKNSQVKIIQDTWVKEIFGTNEVEGILLKNDNTLKVNGIFVELGAKGAMELAANLGVAFDPETFSHVETNRKQETNIPGLYAAGDITGQPWQIAKAVGEGCIAGIEAAEYAKKLANR